MIHSPDKTHTEKGPMGSYTIAGIGEILWDVLEDSEQLGGAPVNFAYHAGELGASSYPVSTVGDDARGRKALLELARRGVNCQHITTRENGTTGYVQATVDQDGIASYVFPDDVAWDNLTLGSTSLELAAKVDAVCFGSLAQRSPISRRAIHTFLQLTGADTLKIFDLNLRQHFYTPEIIRTSLSIANVLKLNDDELLRIRELEQLQGDTLAVMQALVHRFDLQLAVLTRGCNGSLLISPQQVSDHLGFPAEVEDTIGAGDAFTAATAIGLLRGLPLAAINDHANRVAAYVCSKKGAMPPLPTTFRLC